MFAGFFNKKSQSIHSNPNVGIIKDINIDA